MAVAIGGREPFRIRKFSLSHEHRAHGEKHEEYTAAIHLFRLAAIVCTDLTDTSMLGGQAAPIGPISV
jgi:hypothetical protein